MKKFLILIASVLLLSLELNSNSVSRSLQKDLLKESFTKSLDQIRKEVELSRLNKRIDSLSFALESKGVNYVLYSKILGKKESNSNYSVVNKFGYMGKYQFGRKTLNSLIDKGYLKPFSAFTSDDLFLASPMYQEEALASLTLHNSVVLRNYGLYKYIGREIGGVKVTIEGMLAASHLRGPYAVKLFLKTNGEINKTDGNGTSIKDYMSFMSSV